MGPAMAEYNLRARQAKSDAELEQMHEDVFGKLEIPPTSIAKVADHIDYVRKVAGVRARRASAATTTATRCGRTGLEDVSGYPNLFAELIRRGWSDADLKLLAGENVLRALTEAERVAAELQKTTPASLQQLRE